MVPQHERMISDALAVLDNDNAGMVSTVAETLFPMIYEDLEEAILGNPIEHHPIVLGHMLEIAAGEKSPYIPLNQAAALALLHDISAVRKITTQMVADEQKKNAAKGDAFELERQQNRILHMREGSAKAHRHLLKLNAKLGKVFFDAQAIDNICEVIRIHDNPSLGLRIPRCNWLAVAFREADRLWMATHLGVLADLARKEERVQNAQGDDFCREFRGAYAVQLKSNETTIAAPAIYQKQLEKNMLGFRKERALYRPFEPNEGPFCDNLTFFRTETGYAIYQRLRDAAYDRLGTEPPKRLK